MQVNLAEAVDHTKQMFGTLQRRAKAKVLGQSLGEPGAKLLSAPIKLFGTFKRRNITKAN